MKRERKTEKWSRISKDYGTTTKKCNVSTTKISQGEREAGMEAIFKAIITENLPQINI